MAQVDVDGLPSLKDGTQPQNHRNAVLHLQTHYITPPHEAVQFVTSQDGKQHFLKATADQSGSGGWSSTLQVTSSKDVSLALRIVNSHDGATVREEGIPNRTLDHRIWYAKPLVWARTVLILWDNDQLNIQTTEEDKKIGASGPSDAVDGPASKQKDETHLHEHTNVQNDIVGHHAEDVPATDPRTEHKIASTKQSRTEHIPAVNAKTSENTVINENHRSITEAEKEVLEDHPKNKEVENKRTGVEQTASPPSKEPAKPENLISEDLDYNTEVMEDDPVTLECQLTQADRRDGAWYINGRPVASDPRFRVDVLGRTQSLTINNAKVEDNGEIKYTIQGQSTTGTLRVQPGLPDVVSVERLQEGNIITIICILTRGLTSTQGVIWLKDGRPVTRSPGHSVASDGIKHSLNIQTPAGSIRKGAYKVMLEDTQTGCRCKYALE